MVGETGREERVKKRGDVYEQCVFCHRRLDIPKDMDIELRPFYIEGAGQLCYDCYSELYGMIPGSKGRKSDAGLLARGFLTLGPAKNMKK